MAISSRERVVWTLAPQGRRGDLETEREE